MNKRDFSARLALVTPDVPDVFHEAMQKTLGSIVAGELNERMSEPARPKRIRRGTRRTLVLALLIALILATVAVAAFHWKVFDNLWPFSGTTPQNADSLMQSALHQETINNVEITIHEAGYDGRSLFLLYSYRMLDVDTPLGMYRTGESGPGIGEEDLRLLYDHNVGWWIDHIWFNGQCMDMPGGSGGDTSGSATPGEIIETQIWRLDKEEVFLDGKIEISLPIGERQSLDAYRLKEHPEAYGEDGGLLLPQKGMVTFTLDASDTLSRVITEHPNIETVTPDVTMKVREVCFSPLLTYIYVDLEGNPDAIAAYKAENGEGYYDEEGNLLWPYGGMDVYPWVGEMTLVDKEGAVLFPDYYGGEGYGDATAEFIFPYRETWPGELYLAPVVEGAGDMTRAVRVR